jgi:putative copper resistance protein D
MNMLFVTARVVHYASAMLLFGELVFAIAILRPVWRYPRPGVAGAVSGRFIAVTRWSVIASIASAAAWFVAQAAVMSDMPVLQAINPETLGLVLDSTVFGRIWTLRAGLVVALWALLLAMRRSTLDARRSRLAIAAALVAAAYLGAMAWAGHAGAGQGTDGRLQILADVVHLLAAGAWLGALPALVILLGRARTRDEAAQAARRFSALGLVSVTALIASGCVNAWYQVGDVPALIGTGYGRLLLAKLALFAALLGLAVANRGLLVQRVADDDRGARRSLRRNAMLEIALGIGVVTIVGELGVTVPAIHEPPLWPFERTLSFLPMQQSAWVQVVLAGAGTVACFAAVVALKDVLSRPPRLGITALAGIAVPAAIFAWLLAVPAHPTTYVASPIGYTANAIASGSALYAANCATCHGRDGRGDGPVALSLPMKPGDLTERVPDRRVGDLYWWIAYGIRGTPMPGFAPQLANAGIWDLIQFLDAQSAAQNAIPMTDRVKPLRPIAAPDFTYEFTGRAQESLLEPRENRVTLLVFYTLPDSLPRLRQIAMKRRAYTAAGARVIALPMDATSIAPDAASVPHSESIIASAGPAVATAYAMFARPTAAPGNGAPTHTEYLIDRHGYLRVRWIGVPGAATDRTPEALSDIDVLIHEPPRAPPQWGHRH